MCFEPCIIISNTWNFQFQTEKCLLDALVSKPSNKLRLHHLSLRRPHTLHLWNFVGALLDELCGLPAQQQDLITRRQAYLTTSWGQGHSSLMVIRGTCSIPMAQVHQEDLSHSRDSSWLSCFFCHSPIHWCHNHLVGDLGLHLQYPRHGLRDVWEFFQRVLL